MSDDSLEYILEIIQLNIKYFLSFIIITNFIVIFILKTKIKTKEKFDSFFEINKNHKKNKNEKTKNTENDASLLKNNDISKLEEKTSKICNETSFVKDVLLLTAHPDDEIMFFLPTIKSIKSSNNKINLHILCLSNGNYDKLGEIRTEEFNNVCKLLKIEDKEIINDEKLKDGMNEIWEKEYVSDKIKKYLHKNDNYEKIGTIITFDEYGVTKHANHIACHEGLM